MRNINIVKIGASVTDNPEALKKFLHDFARMTGDKILVHGSALPSGCADTSEDAQMACAALVNKRIVAMLQAQGIDAIGVCGADADCMTATPDGTIETVHGPFFVEQLGEVRTPVICAFAHDGHGHLVPCNADDVARAVALGMVSMDFHVALTYCIDQPGVLADLDRPASIVEEITTETLPELIESGAIAQTMLPQARYALEAARLGIAEVIVKHPANLLAPAGTYITA